MKCPVKRIEKSSANIKISNDKNDMIIIDANIKIKNPISWVIDQLGKNKNK